MIVLLVGPKHRMTELVRQWNGSISPSNQSFERGRITSGHLAKVITEGSACWEAVFVIKQVLGVRLKFAQR
jgi:hypothetical protein